MITFIIAFILGAVVGALFARRNLSKVETAVNEAEDVIASAKDKLQKK